MEREAVKIRDGILADATRVQGRGRSRSCQGTVMVEAAMGMAIFMFVLLLGMDLLVTAYQRMTIRYVLTRSARQIILKPLTVDEAKLRVVEVGKKFGLNIRPSEITVCENVDTTCTEPGQAGESTGSAQSLVTVSTRKSVGVFVPIQFSSFIVVRNENFA